MSVTKEIKKLIAQAKQDGKEVLEIPFRGKTIWISKPTRHVIELGMTNARTNPLALGDALIANCWVAGDEDLKKDNGLILSLNGMFDEIVGAKKLELKNC